MSVIVGTLETPPRRASTGEIKEDQLMIQNLVETRSSMSKLERIASIGETLDEISARVIRMWL